jgi:hypothetical protein
MTGNDPTLAPKIFALFRWWWLCERFHVLGGFIVTTPKQTKMSFAVQDCRRIVPWL